MTHPDLLYRMTVQLHEARHVRAAHEAQVRQLVRELRATRPPRSGVRSRLGGWLAALAARVDPAAVAAVADALPNARRGRPANAAQER